MHNECVCMYTNVGHHVYRVSIFEIIALKTAGK